MTVIKMVCAWCGKPMGEKEGGGVEGVSHGICKKCAAKEWKKLRDQYPDTKPLELKRVMPIKRQGDKYEQSKR